MTSGLARRMPKGGKALPIAGPETMFQWYTGIEVPDPITFFTHPSYCDRANLYPRQATLLKVIFLREDLFTDYDYDVVAEWEEDFKNTGNNGISPMLLERMRWLRENGHKWFREVLLVMGRRAGKGHISGLALAYVLWNYMAKGDPQGFYGVDRDKRLTCLIFAGKRDQAKATVFGDVRNVITGAPCFAPYISQVQAERLSVYAPHDFVRMRKMADRGVTAEMDMATFEILPKESTMMAGRGPASFAQAYDEMAHVVASGANRSAEEVYTASTPSLDQFGKDGFIVEPSSPWQMMGQFFDNYNRAIEIDPRGEPVYPEVLMIQLASWDIYLDWERAASLPMFPDNYDPETQTFLPEGETVPEEKRLYFQPLRGAIQTYDEQMKKLEMANPDTFAVERRSHWATALDAYLNPAKIEEMFKPWADRPESYGRPELQFQQQGLLMYSYKAHADPSKSNANFGFALAHPEIGPDGNVHCVFDLIHHWSPADFPGHIVDYEEITEWMWDRVITKFYPEEFTFDQWNSASTIQMLQKRIRAAGFPKRVNVFEETATRKHNWSRAETFKTALNMGWIHSPYYEQAELELKFLQEKNGAVEKPEMGPIQTKDVADCMMECVMTIVGEQVNNFVHGDLSRLRPGGAVPGGVTPFPGSFSDQDDAFAALSRAGRSGRRGGGSGMGQGRPKPGRW